MKYLPVVRRSTILRTDPCLLRAPPHPNATNRSGVTIDENVQSDPGVLVDDPLVGVALTIFGAGGHDPELTHQFVLNRTKSNNMTSYSDGTDVSRSPFGPVSRYLSYSSANNWP